jgi:nanoRNase/pAp phosphatase (c-di-AMP/oligoRNAs hydrolase)
MIEKVITPRRVIDALSSAAVITPLVELNKSNTERRTRICASTLENFKHNILSLDESSSSIKSSDYLELMEAVKEKIKSTVDRSLQLSLLTLSPASWTYKNK